MSRLTSVEEERRLSLYREGLSDYEIARRLGVHRVTIKNWRKRRGLPPHFEAGMPLTPEEEERRLQLYRMGLTDHEIAKAVGVAVSWSGGRCSTAVLHMALQHNITFEARHKGDMIR